MSRMWSRQLSNPWRTILQKLHLDRFLAANIRATDPELWQWEYKVGNLEHLHIISSQETVLIEIDNKSMEHGSLYSLACGVTAHRALEDTF